MRHPVVSGVFYEHDRKRLESHLETLFRGTKAGSCKGVVSPHAGYVYSGRTAAHAISSLGRFRKFILLGPNHNLLGPRFSLSSEEWETPLGSLRVDGDLSEELMKSGIAEKDEMGHFREHSIEVQLPFLQHRFGNFSFVPVSIANSNFSQDFLNDCIRLGEHIARMKGIGIVSSSDFSHYLPKEEADEKDTKALEMIRKLDAKGFFRVLEENDASVCGFGPIAVMISIARKLGLSMKILHKSNSGDATGDFSSVVTYYALGFS